MSYSKEEKEQTMDVVIESVKLASQIHYRQRKKKPIVPDIPYMGHLMEVILSRFGRVKEENCDTLG